MGRTGFKQPGYRSVKRCEVYNGNIITTDYLGENTTIKPWSKEDLE